MIRLAANRGEARLTEIIREAQQLLIVLVNVAGALNIYASSIAGCTIISEKNVGEKTRE